MVCNEHTHCKKHDNIFDVDSFCRFCKEDIENKIESKIRIIKQKHSELDDLQCRLRNYVKDTEQINQIIEEFEKI